MKSIDLFCTSTASTAICSSMEHSAPMHRRGSRPLHRLNSYFSDHPFRNAPCISELPITPRPASFSGDSSRKSSASKNGELMRRKSSADRNDLYSPAGSSRYLLSDTPYFVSAIDAGDSSALVHSKPVKSRDGVGIENDSPKASSFLDSENPKSLALVPSRSVTSRHLTLSSSSDGSVGFNDPPFLKSPSSARSGDQVVVLRVSLHCKGCEGKVRKHLSRMEGVKSFSIDLATKKVTVIGNVTPFGVLTSVTKVKNAQFWPSPPSASPSSSSSSASSSTSTVALS
ncbi:hypothetical protein Nepgr_014159 [Nepenthes gracilis]|uniref:HMA domain-containing protein n=1 Tax=Nepenthes gracilis TaxID=150966 RepID=A0AAD3SIZ6_NEPGR|nr:hypothetical protein Nepgr_014159 [Nepenthes gracilis]